MMLNQMAAGRPEPQWTKYQPHNFKDCEYRVEEMEILGVTNRYIMVRGTVLKKGQVFLALPEGVKPYYPMTDRGFVINYYKYNGDIVFKTSNVTVNNPSANVIFFTSNSENSLFRLFARVS